MKHIPDPELVSTMESMAKDYIERETRTLANIIEVVQKATDISFSNGTVNTELRLSSSDLEAICLRIPAECAFLQAAITNFNIRQMLRDLEIENHITSNLSSFNGSGNAAERMRYAEQMEYNSVVTNTVNKLVSKGIQSYIERADKVYEGVKKVLDYRSKEGWFDRKGY